jgi:hypothetical protein
MNRVLAESREQTITATSIADEISSNKRSHVDSRPCAVEIVPRRHITVYRSFSVHSLFYAEYQQQNVHVQVQPSRLPT